MYSFIHVFIYSCIHLFIYFIIFILAIIYPKNNKEKKITNLVNLNILFKENVPKDVPQNLGKQNKANKEKPIKQSRGKS
ncbi:hypothetical protein [Plasmodium yoelii yoelii]|uniref:Uncharacterized protein n=1 Tax=Plasmodium yoelii yoelii TaxID=73239 RepID=Q7R7W6_PLAYO|nr:hypothetical protein [Plasmodium yoelii yoelii]